jgi:hypothetical protein
MEKQYKLSVNLDASEKYFLMLCEAFNIEEQEEESIKIEKITEKIKAILVKETTNPISQMIAKKATESLMKQTAFIESLANDKMSINIEVV